MCGVNVITVILTLKRDISKKNEEYIRIIGGVFDICFLMFHPENWGR